MKYKLFRSPGDLDKAVRKHELVAVETGKSIDDVADALIRAAQAGNTYAIQMFMEITGEAGMSGPAKENNLLEAIQNATKEDMDTDDLPELQQASTADTDLVE